MHMLLAKGMEMYNINNRSISQTSAGSDPLLDRLRRRVLRGELEAVRARGGESGQRARVGYHVPGEGERHVLVVSEEGERESHNEQYPLVLELSGVCISL